MEVNDQLITMATGNIGSPGSQRYTKAMKMKAERMKELTARQGKIEEKLRSKIEELKMLCLQEAGLTGRLPSDYPLDPGEMPPTVNQRVTITSKGRNPSTKPGEDTRLWDLEQRFQLQGRIANSSRALGARASQAGEQRVRRKDEYQHRQVPDHRNSEIQRDYHFPRDEAALTVKLGTDGLSSPRMESWGDGRAVGCSHGWTLLPTDISCQAKGRRNSYASPVRMLQRSMSGTGRRSVPSSPVIYRDRSGHYRYLSPAPGGCQQLPDTADCRVEVSSETGMQRPLAGGRTRRSSSSETLSDSAAFNRYSRRSRGDGGGGASGARTGQSGPQLPSGYHSQCRPVPVSPARGAHHRGMGGQADRDIHRALALEGLRAWYMRAAVYGYPQERMTLGWDRRLHPAGAVRPSYSPTTPRVNWEALRRPARASHQVGVTTRRYWCDPPC